MSKSNRGTYFAIGLIAGVAISMFFLVWSFPGFRDPTYQQEKYQSAKDHETGQNNPVVRPSFWETYTSPTDTYAQWVMAILSIAATATSIWAVKLLNDTLGATRDMVNEAKTTTEATKQAVYNERAWVCFDTITNSKATRITYEDVPYEKGLAFTINFRNFGRSPAINVGSVREGFTIEVNESQYNLADVNFDEKFATGIVPPNGVFHSDALALFGDDLVRFRNRDAKFVIHAIAWYRDIFRGDVLHRTESVLELRYNGTVEVNGIMEDNILVAFSHPLNIAT